MLCNMKILKRLLNEKIAAWRTMKEAARLFWDMMISKESHTERERDRERETY